MSFNASQTRAIHHKNGPMLVLAGPGSGKTLVITERTKYLIEECGIDPAQILVITFTKAAATEMKRRFQRKMNRLCPVTFGTFHAVYFAILKHAYNYSADNIAREEQRYQCMREIIAKEHLTYEDETEFITSLLGEISLVKNSGIEIANYYSNNCAETVFRKIYRQYHEFLYKNRLIDFDDMLVYTKELFEQRADILAAWQNKYRYILIDEFQDINKIQYEIVKMLAGETKNLFIVGDDDQSIYKFRGARPELMLNFPKDFENTRQVILNRNYRCGEEIVQVAEDIISYNTKRFEKKMQAREDAASMVEVRTFKDHYEENKHIIYTIKEEMAKITNANHEKGTLSEVIKGADVFIGVSAPGTLTPDMVRTMAKDPIIFACANPTPEIFPEEAKAAGAAVVSTGRSDYPNQVNNVLCFPGIFRGALDVRASDINDEMKIAAAYAIAGLVSDEELCADYILPAAFDSRVKDAVAKATAEAAIKSGVARI